MPALFAFAGFIIGMIGIASEHFQECRLCHIGLPIVTGMNLLLLILLTKKRR